MSQVMFYKTVCLLSAIMFQNLLALGQEAGIIVPSLGDKYSAYVRKLEDGDLTIDYTDFRNSFLDSKQYNNKGAKYDSLKKQTYVAIKDKNYQAVLKNTKEMLSIDYTSLFAHKYLQQTYKILGDTAASRKYHDIEFGLLRSITRSGNGKSCATGWHVTQIEEEYFMIDIMGAQLQSQSVSSEGNNACDKIIIKMEDGLIRTCYFEANKVFEMENKIFGK